MTKKHINFFWNQQPFRLPLAGYEGNCKVCWKKSDRKLEKIAQESPEAFDFFERMEGAYGTFVPESRRKLIEARGETVRLPVRFFRGFRSVSDIKLDAFLSDIIEVTDDHLQEESCDIYSNCEDNERI